MSTQAPPQLFLTASVTINGLKHSLSFSLDENSVKPPLTEKKVEKCYMAMMPSLLKAMRDGDIFVNSCD